MRAAIFSFVKVSDSSVVASVRIARYVRDLLKLPLFDDEKIDGQTNLDVLLIVNGAYAFCRCLPELANAIECAKRVVWIQNDYTVIPPKSDGEAESPFRKAFRNRKLRGQPGIDYWTTVEDNAKAQGSTYVNWNCLTFEEQDEQRVVVRRKARQETLFYYGSFRAGRTKYFDRYMADPKQVPVVVSSPAAKKFAERYPKVHVSEKMTDNFWSTLGQHGLGLYIEDKLSHSHFHSPANRFYEMLAAGLPMVFQPECGTMMRKAGYDPTPYVADNILGVERALKRSEEILHQQRNTWLPKARESYRLLPESVRAAWKTTQELVS